MSSRDEILARIRAATVSDTRPVLREQQVRKHIRDHPAGVVPHAPKTPAATRKLFVEKAKAAAASVDVVRPGQEADAIAAWLRRHNLPNELRVGTSARLRRIAWPRRGGTQRETAIGDGGVFTALGHAVAGIAETGTLVLVSGPQNPTTLNFLAENHIVVLDEKDIVADHESVWAQLRRKFGARQLPRTVNMITGPSRSADIEQTLILGAHGPVRLHVVLVRNK